MLTKKSLWVHLMMLISLVIILIDDVDGAKKRKRGRRSRYGSREDQNYAAPLYFLLFLLFCIFAPVVCMFAYSVYKDPATPDVMKAVWKFLKERSTGYLSRDHQHDE